MGRVVFLAVLVATLTASADAFAGTASRSGERNVSYVAGPGEANHVLVVQDTGGVRIVDLGAPVVAGANCTAASANEVVCASPRGARVTVDLGDLNDFALVSGEFDFVKEDGGAGNDVIRAAGSHGFPNLLIGGEGEDDLEGGGGVVLNRLRGGPGNDVLRGGRATFDIADYSERTAAVTVDLDGVADDGEAGEADTLIEIERIDGGAGDDFLTGDGKINSLHGGGGADTLVGRGGTDFLQGGKGADTLSGGASFDSLRGGDGDDTLSGGGGGDALNGNDGADTVRGDAGRDGLRGGRGQDTLFARDGRSDRVNGGPGSDRARIDRGLDRLVEIESLF